MTALTTDNIIDYLSANNLAVRAAIQVAHDPHIHGFPELIELPAVIFELAQIMELGTSSQVIKGNGTIGSVAYSSLTGLPALFTPTLGVHVADTATNSATDAATNNPTDAPTNLNALTTLLGALTGEVNATNQRQNTIASNLNALAGKYNSAIGVLNAAAARLNTVADILEANAMSAAT